MNWTERDADGRAVPIQWDLRDRPFWLLVACVLLNRAGGHQAKPALEEIMRRWSTAEDLADCCIVALEGVCRPCGLHEQRARRIRHLANVVVERGLPVCAEDVLKYPGCGPYARDSYAIFVLGDHVPDPEDHVLRDWVRSSLR